MYPQAQKVAEHDGDARRLVERENGKGSVETVFRSPPGRQEPEQGEDLAHSLLGLRHLPQGIAEGRDSDTVLPRSGDVRESRSRLYGEPEFLRVPRLHRGARVNEEVDGTVLLRREELDHEPAESGPHAPVDGPQVVSRAVRAVIVELQARSFPVGSLESVALPPSYPLRDEGELFEFREEFLAEQDRFGP